MKQDNFIKVISQIRKVGIPDDVQEIAKTFINNDKMDQGKALAAAFKLSDVEPNSVQKYAIEILSNPTANNVGSWLYGAPPGLQSSKGFISRLNADSNDYIKKLPLMKLMGDYDKIEMSKNLLSVNGNTVKQTKILEALGLLKA